jgi:hypothetical protein
MLASTSNPPTSIDRLQAIHYTCQIAGDRQIATRKFLQRANSSFAVVDRMEPVQEQQFGPLACIFTVVLVSNSQQGIFARITNQHFGNVGFQKIVQPKGTSSFFKAHLQTTAQTMNKLEDSLGFRFECGFHHQFSARIPNRR